MSLLYDIVILYAIILKTFLLLFISLYCIIFIKGDDNMKKRVTFSLEPQLIERLKEFSEKTMIPQSKLVERAIKEKINELSKES